MYADFEGMEIEKQIDEAGRSGPELQIDFDVKEVQKIAQHYISAGSDEDDEGVEEEDDDIEPEFLAKNQA